jgi:serine/threonine-protein phosphatase 2A regulatory subunit A
VLSLGIIESAILPIMDRLVSDDIPNIRFNVAKSYAVLIDVLKRVPETGTLVSAEKDGIPLHGSAKGTQLIHEKVLPALEKLQEDDDVDVRYFATTAAQTIDGGEEMQT